MNKVTQISFISLFCFVCFNISAQQNCETIDICENALELIFDSAYERTVECDTIPDIAEGQSLAISSCNSNVEKNNAYFESHCITPNLQVVWYKFNTGDHEYTDIKVNKGSFNPIKSFGIDIFAACNSASSLNYCDFAGQNDEYARLTELKLEKFTDYYIAVGSRLQDTGSYEILLDNYNLDEIDKCSIASANITPNKQPPYQTGDTITFSVYIPEFTDPFVNWGQGIVPVFGAGWDPSSFEKLGGGPVIQEAPNENWHWWDEGNIHVNLDIQGVKTYTDNLGRTAICVDGDCPAAVMSCLNENQFLPGGWYAYQDGSGSGCAQGSGDPNLGWGDGGGTWEFSFALIVGAPSDPNIAGEIDLSVKIFTFSDLQIGCWPLQDHYCKVNSPGEVKAFNINCTNPAISAGEDFQVDCGDEGIEVIGEGPSGSNFLQYWGTLDGEIMGSNESYSIQINKTGKYRLFVEDTNTGCVTYDDVEIVYNTSDLDLKVNGNACFGDSGGSAGVISNGLVVWSTGETGNEISDLPAGHYSVTITEGDCERVLEFQIEEPETELIISSEQEVGSNSGTITIDIEGGLGEYEITWFYNGSSIAYDVTKLTVSHEGEYFITVIDANGCSKSIVIDIQFTTSVISFGDKESIIAYPNPVINSLYLKGEAVEKISSFEIISVTGQVVNGSREIIQSGQINVAYLNPGQYILKIITVEGNQGILKFIKN